MKTKNNLAKEFLDHYENLLGKVNNTWKIKLNNKLNQLNNNDVYITEILNSPKEGFTTYATLGFSEYIFEFDNTLKRYEFFISVYNKYKDNNIRDILFSVADYILDLGKQIRIGDMIRGEGFLFENSNLQHYFCYIPAYYERDDLYVFKKCNPFVYFGWIMFITDGELKYIKENGWEKFVDLLEEKDPDLLDIYRPSII